MAAAVREKLQTHDRDVAAFVKAAKSAEEEMLIELIGFTEEASVELTDEELDRIEPFRKYDPTLPSKERYREEVRARKKDAT